MYTFSLQPLNYINYIWIIKYKSYPWRLCSRPEVKINAFLTLALHMTQWSVSNSSWCNLRKTKLQQPLFIKLGGLRSWSGHEDENRMPVFVTKWTAIIQTTATFTHTHTHNKLKIANQSVMTCHSDHVNLGCAPKKKKNIKNEPESSESFFP